MSFSRLLNIHQKFPDRRVADIPSTIEMELTTAGFGENLKPGARIAIGVGSRGIANIATIVRSVVDYWKSRGFSPFLFPAMGSHGAATAEGQADVLAHYGIVESTMGCPVVSSLEVVPLGSTPDGIDAFMDKNAFSADGVFLVGRVKWHTDFAGKIESGLFKMMAIGLGKFAGAQRYHTFAYRLGLEHVIRSIGRQVLKSGKILGGLAILEDANHHTGQLTAVRVEQMERKEEELLALVKSWMGRIPVKELDILIIDEIGKTYSGAGMDTKVVNRGVNGEYNPWDTAPRIRPNLRSRAEQSELRQRRRPGDGRRDQRPAAEGDRLEADADQFSDRIDARGDPHADPFPDRPNVPGEILADSRQVQSGRRDHRLDREFDGTGNAAVKRESAARDRGEPDADDRRLGGGAGFR